MSSDQQASLGQYANSIPSKESTSTPTPSPKLGFKTRPQPVTLPEHIQQARQVNWVAFTGRYPYVFDAARLGFAIGHREDSSYQWTPDEVDLPVHFLDNNYQNANLDRFVSRVFEYQPEIAVIGDLYDSSELRPHLEAANEIWSSFPEMDLLIVPKDNSLLDEIPSDFILGYPNGTSPTQAGDIADYATWRSLPHDLHILGGTPLGTLDEIKQLTNRRITGEPPANIVGLDWNGYQRYAENYGDYASAEGGWHRDLRDKYPTKRDLIRYSLLNAKHFWIRHRIWPSSSVDDLPLRPELQSATKGQNVTLTEDFDRRELSLSPSPETQRHTQPVFRTDDTQAEIIEPLSPLASLYEDLSWSPSGSLSGTTHYSTPRAHHVEPVCTGCGKHLLQKSQQPDDPSNRQPTTETTISLVSYERQSQSTDQDYESVPTEGPDSLPTEHRFPSIHVFCSSTCRNQVEGRNPYQLLNNIDPVTEPIPDWNNMGEELARFSISSTD